MAKKNKKGAGDIILDMTNVESGGSRRFPEGDYVVEITKVEKGTSQYGNSQLIVTYTITEGKFEGKTIKDYMQLTEKSLWRVGNLLDAVGIKWSKKKFKLPSDDLLGKELGVTLTDDEYNGKIKSKISDFLDEETARSAADMEDEPDYEDMSLEELIEAAEEEDLDLDEILGKGKKKLKGGKAKKALIAALEGEDDDDDGDEEDEDDLDI